MNPKHNPLFLYIPSHFFYPYLFQAYTRFVSSTFNEQLTTWKKRNAMADEPKSGTSIEIVSFRSKNFRPAVYDTRLFTNREENRGYPPRGGVATRQIGFAFGGTPVYFIGYVWYIDQNGALLLVLCPPVPCPDYERAERSGVPDEDLCERKLCESKEVFPIALKLEKIGATWTWI